MLQNKITPGDLAGKGVRGMADTPQLSAADMQAKLDELAADVIVPKHNSLVDSLAATSAASKIGAAGGTVQSALDSKAAATNVLTLNNTTPFTPSADYHPATKKLVDDAVFDAGAADMRKAVYDTDNDGVVDDSEKLGGKLPAEYMGTAGGTFTDNVSFLKGKGIRFPMGGTKELRIYVNENGVILMFIIDTATTPSTTTTILRINPDGTYNSQTTLMPKSGGECSGVMLSGSAVPAYNGYAFRNIQVVDNASAPVATKAILMKRR